MAIISSVLDRGPWRATVYEVTTSWTWLRDWIHSQENSSENMKILPLRQPEADNVFIPISTILSLWRWVYSHQRVLQMFERGRNWPLFKVKRVWNFEGIYVYPNETAEICVWITKDYSYYSPTSGSWNSDLSGKQSFGRKHWPKKTCVYN